MGWKLTAEARGRTTSTSLMPPKTLRVPRWNSIDLTISRATRTPAQQLPIYSFRPYASEVPPRPARVLRDGREPHRLKPWLRNFIIGACLGSIYFTSYRYYNEKKLKDAFVVYKLAAKEPVSSTASIFQLEPEQKSQDFQTYKDAWRKGVWNLQFKQPQIQIVRAYTPLPPKADAPQNCEDHLRFLIRRDPHGEVSSYLHSLPIGSKIELRGPNLEYALTPDVKQVVFFAGGTGIAPALQVAHTMFDIDGNKRGQKLHILWANRKREDCIGGYSDAPPLEPVPPKPSWSGFFTPKKPKAEILATLERGVIVRELEELKEKYPGQVTVEYYVNEEDTWIDKDAVFRALSRFDDKDFSLGSATPQEQRQILISGPSGFISYLAGPKEWCGGREEQGGVSKIIAHAISMNPHNVKVWKI
jgi:ferredoxin-NADP reductase